MIDRSRNRAFTLIELLVVIGILVLLMGFALPALVKMIGGGKKTRTAADLASVAMALDAYKLDHGDYPRPTSANTGFAMLGQALIAPGGAFESAPPFTAGKTYAAGDVAPSGAGTSYAEHVFFAGPNDQLKYEPNPGGTAAAAPPGANWGSVRYSDGHNGPGFKVRAGAAQTFGPYLDPGKWKLRGLALLDGNDNPILYFPARPGKIAQNAAGWPLVGAAGVPAGAMYDSAHNGIFFQRPSDTAPANAAARMHALLITNPSDLDGVVEPNAGESAVTTQPYLLWAAGEDGVFGAGKPDHAGMLTLPADADAIKTCDDVTNFR